MALRVMDITSKMINAIDLLSIDITDIDQVCPAVVEIQNALNIYPNLPPDIECVTKIAFWVTTLKGKAVTDTLTDDEIKQLKFDLEASF